MCAKAVPTKLSSSASIAGEGRARLAQDTAQAHSGLSRTRRTDRSGLYVQG